MSLGDVPAIGRKLAEWAEAFRGRPRRFHSEGRVGARVPSLVEAGSDGRPTGEVKIAADSRTGRGSDRVGSCVASGNGWVPETIVAADRGLQARPRGPGTDKEKRNRPIRGKKFRNIRSFTAITV